MHVRAGTSLVAVAFTLLLVSCSKPADKAAPGASAAQVDIYAKAGSAGKEWLTYGGTYDEQRHSSLKQVNADNVGQLGVAWTYNLRA